MAREVNGIWQPWEHPDYRRMDHSIKGWFRDSRSGKVVAALGVERDPATGKEKVRYAVYDFNPPYRGGHGGRWVADRFLEIYEPLPRDFDPRYATAA